MLTECILLSPILPLKPYCDFIAVNVSPPFPLSFPSILFRFRTDIMAISDDFVEDVQAERSWLYQCCL